MIPSGNMRKRKEIIHRDFVGTDEIFFLQKVRNLFPNFKLECLCIV